MSALYLRTLSGAALGPVDIRQRTHRSYLEPLCRHGVAEQPAAPILRFRPLRVQSPLGWLGKQVTF